MKNLLVAVYPSRSKKNAAFKTIKELNLLSLNTENKKFISSCRNNSLH